MAPLFPIRSLVRRSSSRRLRRGGVLVAAASLALLGAASPGAALETVEPSTVESASGEGCPTLTAIKYPWLGCSSNEHGGITLSLPSQPAPKACEWRLPDGECAAAAREWGLVPMIPRGD